MKKRIAYEIWFYMLGLRRQSALWMVRAGWILGLVTGAGNAWAQGQSPAPAPAAVSLRGSGGNLANLLDEPSAAHGGTAVRPEDVIFWKAVGAEATKTNAVRIDIQLQTKQEFKVYTKGLVFFAQSAQGLPVGPLHYVSQPAALETYDPWYKERRAYLANGTLVTLEIPVQDAWQETHWAKLNVEFQACSHKHCLLPVTLPVQTTGLKPWSSSPSQKKNEALENSSLKSENSIKNPVDSEQNSFAHWVRTLQNRVPQLLREKSFWLFPVLFLGGMLMNLTPCVYPMIPITLAFLQRSHDSHSVLKTNPSAQPVPPMGTSQKIRVLWYGAGIVLSYASLGLVAGLGGILFGSILQNPWFLLFITLVFALLGFTMLGRVDVGFIQRLAHRVPLSQSKPRVTAFLMGALSGAVAAPCTGPVLSALLLLIAANRDPVQGFVYLATCASGFAFPYVAWGLWAPQAAYRLPKARVFSLLVKVLFSALLFGLSLYFLKSLLMSMGGLGGFEVLYRQPSVVFFVTILSLFLCFFILILSKFSYLTRVATGFCVALGSLLGLWLTLGVTSSFSQPVIGEVPSARAPHRPVIPWHTDLQPALNAALGQRPIPLVVVDIWAQWCAACHEMDRDLWPLAPVVSLLGSSRILPVKLDFTTSSAQTSSLSRAWGITGLPAVVLLRYSETKQRFEVVQVLQGHIDSQNLMQAVQGALPDGER